MSDQLKQFPKEWRIRQKKIKKLFCQLCTMEITDFTVYTQKYCSICKEAATDLRNRFAMRRYRAKNKKI